MTRTLSLCAAALGMLLYANCATAQVPRVPAPQVQSLTIQGDWGYPCALDWRCGMLPEERWQPLEVVAWVGTRRFVGGFLDEDAARGPFEVVVQVPPQQRGAMVLLEVLAQSPEGHTARFRSLQDSAGRLLDEAGPDGRVGGTGRRPNQVTVLSTALVGLLQDGNGGEWRMGEARLLELLHQVDPRRLMRHAQVFHGVNMGLLPGTGAVDPNALIASTQAVEAFLVDVPEEDLAFAYDSFHTGGQTAFQEVDLGAMDMTMLPPASAGTIAFGRRAGVRLRMNDEWSTDGFSGSAIDTGRVGGVGALFLPNTDSFPRSARVVRPGNASQEFERIAFDCPGSGRVQALRVTARSPGMFRRMAIAGGLEFVEYAESRSHEYRLDVGVDPACAAGLPGYEYEPGYYLAHPTRAVGRARDALAVSGSVVALQLLNPDVELGREDTQFIAGTVDLATGSVDAPGYADSALVAVDADGMLRLEMETLPGSLREGVVDVRIERVRGDGLGAEEWMVSSRLRASTDDHLRAHVTPAVRRAVALALTPQHLEGTWGSGIDLSLPEAVDVATVEFKAVSGEGLAVGSDGVPVPFSWRIEDGDVLASTFALASNPEALLPACPAGADDCNEVQRRVWDPLRRATRGPTERLYVIEEFWRDAGGGLQRESRQLNFYDAY